MRFILLLIPLLYSSYVRTQSKIDTVMEKAFCNCFHEIVGTEDSIMLSFSTCLTKSLGKDTVLLRDECLRIYGEVNFESYSKLGSDLFKKNSSNLVLTCDAFYNYYDSIRFSQFNSLNKNSVKTSIDSLNNTISKARNEDFFIKRGFLYTALGEYNIAKKDFDEALAINPNSPQGLYYSGIIYEIRKDYDNAIRIYNFMFSATKNNLFNICKAIAERKKNSL